LAQINRAIIAGATEAELKDLVARLVAERKRVQAAA